MQAPQIFVSFSNKDSAGVQRLIARLGAQPLAVWDYSTEGQEIPLGVDINTYLEQKISRCNAFIPVLSKNSFLSNYTACEVSSAMSQYQAGNLIILPLLMKDCELCGKWPSPYDQLAGMRFYQIDFFSRQAIEEIVMIICEILGIIYRPLLMSDEQLPFMDKLSTELKGKCPNKAEREIGIYRRMMLILDEFQYAYMSGDFQSALEKSTYLVMNLENEFGKESFYYPYIVQAICQISCGHLMQATDTLNNVWNSSSIDENAFAVMGYIRYQQGNYREALDFYQAASDYDKQDPATKSWVAKTTLLLGLSVDVDTLFDTATEARIISEKDKRSFFILKAQALASAKRFAESQLLYKELIARGVYEPNILINYAYVLIEMGLSHEALTMLENYEKNIEFTNPDYAHLVASLSFLLEQPQRAADKFKRLVEHWPHNRQYRLDAGQVLWKIGRVEEARRITAPMVQDDRFPLPASEHDFYCDGFANWLQGKFALAEYDFRRSHQPNTSYYDAIISNDKVYFNIAE